MEQYRRIFVIVMDSLGAGAMEDSLEFGDVGVNTLGHISQAVDSFTIPHLRKMGMANLTPLKTGGAGRKGYRLLRNSPGKEPGQGHNDRSLGDDGIRG